MLEVGDRVVTLEGAKYKLPAHLQNRVGVVTSIILGNSRDTDRVWVDLGDAHGKSNWFRHTELKYYALEAPLPLGWCHQSQDHAAHTYVYMGAQHHCRGAAEGRPPEEITLPYDEVVEGLRANVSKLQRKLNAQQQFIIKLQARNARLRHALEVAKPYRDRLKAAAWRCLNGFDDGNIVDQFFLTELREALTAKEEVE